MRFNWHGLIGLIGIALMITVSALKSWDISLFFLTAAVVVYAIAIIALSTSDYASEAAPDSRNDYRYNEWKIGRRWYLAWLNGWHIAAILLAIALALTPLPWEVENFLFVLCILVGHTFARTRIVPALWWGNLGIVLVVISTLVQGSGLHARFSGVAILVFCIWVVSLALMVMERSPYEDQLRQQDPRTLFGWGLSLWVWAAALNLPLASLSAGGFFLVYIASLAIGFAVPFMLFRK
jgi:hypothetical protein